MMKVFVYGTLKQGEDNWARLLRGRAEFVGYGKTVARFSMYCVGFPKIYPDPDGNQVNGEVFEVGLETLRRLDRLESEGYLYDRTLQLVDMADGQTELCMAYVAKGRPDVYGDRVNPNEQGTLTWLRR